jgi:eukaryotic-like serine/threonine-protein kinase
VADFGGRYRLDRRLGAGGMGEVWLAYDEDLGDRPVAIKVMRSRMLADDDDLARFQREMQLASRMHHPNIMTVFTTGSDRGVPFMVMEYLQGSDLGKIPVGWSFREIARIGRETCMALAYAHGLSPGVVHRDIKPGNLFVCDTGLVKVTDFGLAKAVTGSSLTLSTTGTVLGTLPYISPEQWLGTPAAFSNDVWAVGCVLYELLSGKPPRLYDTPIEHVTAAARGEFVASLPNDTGVPAWLADAVLAMLHPDPLDRPTAGEAVQMLSTRRAHTAQAPVASPQQPAAMLQSPTRRDMAFAAARLPEAESPRRQGHLPPNSLLNSTGPVISPHGRQEASPTDPTGASARVFLPAKRAIRPRKRRNLLISSIAALGAIAAGIYLAVSAFAGPTLSPGTGAFRTPGAAARQSRPEVNKQSPPGVTGQSPKSATVVQAPPADPSAAMKIAYLMMPSFGFNQQQYTCVLALWKGSGWNVYAKGPGGQYGIPQALPGDAMAAAGPDWQTDATTQIKWGLSYIKKTYGTPCAALAAEEKTGYY